MKLAIISLGGKSSGMVLEEAKKYFTTVDFLNIKDIEVHADSKDIGILYKGTPLEKYDCIYIRGSYKYLLLQRSLTTALQNDVYMPIAPSAFTIGHNKLLTLIELQKKNIPIPKTYLAITTNSAKKILEQVHYPVIMKIPFGTHGKGVMFADSLAAAKSLLDALEVFKQPYIIQEYVGTKGREISDIRAIVVGGEVVAAMKRKAAVEELRANIHMGAIGEPCELDYDSRQIAIRSAKAIGADICAVDLLEGVKTVVIEINLSPGLKGITEATKKNVARKIAKFLAEQTKLFNESKKSTGYGKIMKELEITTKNDKTKEILTNLNIKEGIIKLPRIITDITKFTPDDEIALIVKKGQLVIKKHEIEKGK